MTASTIILIAVVCPVALYMFARALTFVIEWLCDLIIDKFNLYDDEGLGYDDDCRRVTERRQYRGKA